MHNKTTCNIKEIPTSGVNLLIADEDAPDIKLGGVSLKRNLLIRLGLRSANFKDCQFLKCIFEDCYLRKAEFHNVDFTGSFFKGCNLEKATFEACKFWYVHFFRCRLNYEEILQCLPTEPNIAILLLRTLKQNAVEMGEKKIADKLLIKEIETEKRELKNRFLGVSEYYKKRYDIIARIKNGLMFLALSFSGKIWGHGLRIVNILRSAIVIILVFALLFHQYGVFGYRSGNVVSITLMQAIYVSTITFTTLGYGDYTPVSIISQFMCAAESLLGIVFLGFLAAAVYRRLAR